MCFDTYQCRWLHHDLNTNFGLLVLVDQPHQLLCIVSLDQHDWTGKRVCFPQLQKEQ